MDNLLKEKILKAEVVSFDMFDTLVIRIIDNPEILFDMMGKIFEINNFRKIRTSMQAELGLKLQETKNYPHANIDEIYEYIKENTTISNTDELMKYEINKEIELLYQNKEIYDVYKFAKDNNKRVIVTSDMYLYKDTITKVLTKCGYKDIDRIYLSSEERKAKFDGTLYDYVIEQEKVSPNEILHIGDSLKDDVTIASSKGLEVYHYQGTKVEKSNDISLSIANGIIRLINKTEEDFWVKTGSIAGLMYLGLYKRLSDSNKKQIYFLARDGYNLYNLFKKYNNDVEAHYLYTSRRALLLASINELNDEVKDSLPPFTFGQTIKEILEYICMDNIFTIEDIKKVGFNSFEDRIKNVDDLLRFKDIYSLKEKEVLDVCKKERDNALEYFKKSGIFDNRMLFFDCGWSGSSQFLLENFIKNSNYNVNVEFFYNGILENDKSIRQLNNRIHSSFLFDIGYNQDIARRVVDSIVILELFFGAPENSVFKYDKNTYVLDNYENNLDYKNKIYKGIELFFEYALPIFEEYNYSIDSRNAIAPILRLIENPTKEEAITIGDIENVDAFAKQDGVHKYIAKLTMDDINNNKNIEVYWKYGLVARNDIDEKVKEFVKKKYGMKKTIFSSITKPFIILKRKTISFFRLVKRMWKKYHFIIPPRVIKTFILRKLKHEQGIQTNGILNPFNKNDYNNWLNSNVRNGITEKLDYNPLISFVIPVYNVKKELLKECLESVLNQTYKNIEICLADDCSTNEETLNTLKEYEENYKNIKVVYREKNGHISASSNSALELVTGEYVAMMDNDDVIPSNAIYEMVKALNNDKSIDMIYTDEDKLDTKGTRCDPHFKSDYAPDTLLSVNYFCHFTLLRTSILRKIGGWKVGYEGAQDWDLFLRFVEQAKNIYHLPKVLYQWRMIEGSTSMTLNNKKYAMDTAKKSIEDALERRNTPGIVHLHDKVPYYWIEYTYEKEPLISIIIPTKDYASTLDKCLKSLYKKTTYKNFEVIVVDNNSVENDTFKLFDKYEKEHENFRVIKADMEFNYSKINNLAAKEAKGEYLVLLNNDTELITENWLQLMVGYAMQDHIGAVGVKLIYPDKTIQHGGVVLGMGGVAGHVFVNESMDSQGIYGRLCVPYNYSAVTAACLMVKKSKFDEVNGLTEELKVAYNDIDFCLKLVDKGYKNIMVPMVELFHYESKSRGLENTEEKKKRFEKESNYMYEHWNNYIKNDPMYNINLSRKREFMLESENVDK